MADPFARLTGRDGHFRLESGYHTDRWLDLETRWRDPVELELVAELAEMLSPFRPSAICGPLVGGALLALAVAARLRVRFL
jgi:orotate phosphoribosyltransferase